MALSDRIPYQAQIDRPKLTLPGGKKLAVWVILNVEEWRIENAMPRTVLSPPMGQPLPTSLGSMLVASLVHVRRMRSVRRTHGRVAVKRGLAHPDNA